MASLTGALVTLVTVGTPVTPVVGAVTTNPWWSRDAPPWSKIQSAISTVSVWLWVSEVSAAMYLTKKVD